MVRKNEEVLLWGYCGVGGRTVLAALLCRHPMQRYAVTSDVTLHFYPATHFAQTRQPAAGGRSNLPKSRHDISGSSSHMLTQCSVEFPV